MAIDRNEIEMQKEFFLLKLAAECQTNDVVKKIKEGKGEDFVLLDTRDRASYEKEHIPGALAMPLDEVEAGAGKLDRSKKYVTYCWHAT